MAWRQPPMAALKIEPNPADEFPQWLRDCGEAFKKDKCHLTHELRTLENWRRFNNRVDTSPYKHVTRSVCPTCEMNQKLGKREAGKGKIPCSCNQELNEHLPHLDSSGFPAELVGADNDTERRRKRKVARSRVKVESDMADIDDEAVALLGDDGLESVKFSAEDFRREQKDDDKAAEGEQVRTSDREDGDEEVEDDEDMETADYGAGERYDDDDDLVDEEGGGSDDEEARYGTF